MSSVTSPALFLIERIDELDWSDWNVFQREWHGHVAPSLARLRDLFAKSAPVAEPNAREKIISTAKKLAARMGAEFVEHPSPAPVAPDWPDEGAVERARAVWDTRTDLEQTERALLALQAARLTPELEALTEAAKQIPARPDLIAEIDWAVARELCIAAVEYAARTQEEPT